MSTFKPLLKTRSEKGPEQHKRGGGDASLIVIKDQLPIQVWLSIGAIANGILILTIGRIALAIPFLIIVTRVTNALLIAYGLKENHYKAGVIPGKFSAQLPNADGTFGPKPASQGITLLLIGTRSNHPLGILAPGFKQFGNHMTAMQKDLNERAAHYGLLSSSSWIGSERASGNEFMFAMYFRSADDIHRFAHDPLHREAWSFYNRLMADKTTDYSHISIWHEIVAAQPGSWETVYANSHPTLLGSARVPIKTSSSKEGDQVEWHSTVVDASRGLLKSSRGRMARTDGKDNDQYGYDDPQRSLEEGKLDL